MAERTHEESHEPQPRVLPEERDPHPWEDRGKRHVFSLLAGFLAGPLAWALALQGGYSLVTTNCEGSLPWLHAVHGASLLLAAGGALLSLAHLRAARAMPGGAPHREREVFVSTLGLVLGVAFVLVVLAAAVPSFLLDPCQS